MQTFTHDEAYAAYKGTEYGEKHATIEYPEGFRERLAGKSIEEQLRLFAVVETDVYASYSYGEEDSRRVTTRTVPAEELAEFRGVVLENGLVEGIMIEDYRGEIVPLAPGDAETTYYASDDDGPGGSSRNVTVQLTCLAEEAE